MEVATDKLLDLETLPGQELASVRMTGLKKDTVTLNFRTADAVFLQNHGGEVVTPAPLYALANFPSKGCKFQKEVVENLSVPFELKRCR